MIVDLRELRERGEPLFVEADFPESALTIRSETVSLASPARARFKVTMSGDRVRVNGQLEAELNVSCSRCLKQLPERLKKNIDLEYWPDPAVEKEGEEIALSYDELDIGFYRNDRLDLSAVSGEQILLDLPMKPVCREDCKGLCPQCGIDLNEATCSCEPDTLDPRWASLQDLKKKLQS
jgi:uncharacterized protein